MKDLLSKRLNALQVFSDKRDYIGASLIGDVCHRKIWYASNGYSQDITVKQQMTFDIGHAIEKIVKNLIENLWDVSECKQMDVGAIKGTPDGIINHPDYGKCLLEIKSANASSYGRFLKDGLQLWSSIYYVQMQMYMHMLKLEKGFIFVVNKNTGDFSDELVEYDPIIVEEMLAKAEMIKRYKEAPHGISENGMRWECKMCGFYKTCQGIK